MSFVWALLFILAVVVFWSLNLLGLPGNWLIAATTLVYAWLTSGPESGGLRWTVVFIVVALAILGELVEFAASAAGVKRVGGSRRGAILALAGSIAGALVGMFVGIPIPAVGSLIAALVFAGLGATLGAMVGEVTVGQSWTHSWKVGRAAFWGRLLGTAAKTLVGAVMAGVATALVFVS
jgi:uncharacterized protein YqgC (DUF456 family)